MGHKATPATSVISIFDKVLDTNLSKRRRYIWGHQSYAQLVLSAFLTRCLGKSNTLLVY